jgi:type IV secretion system coupling TraD/TrwB family protein
MAVSHQHPKTRARLVPLTSLWLDTLVLRLMNEPQPTSRRTWFVIDELASLQRLPQLGFPLAKFILLCRHPCNSSRPPPPFSSHCRMRGRERPAEAVVIRSTRSELVVLGLLVCSVHASHATRDRPEHRTKKPMGRPCQGTWSRLVLKAHAAGDVRAVFVLPGNLVMVPRP